MQLPELPDDGAIKALEDASAAFQMLKWITGVMFGLCVAIGTLFWNNLKAERERDRKKLDECETELKHLLSK